MESASMECESSGHATIVVRQKKSLTFVGCFVGLFVGDFVGDLTGGAKDVPQAQLKITGVYVAQLPPLRISRPVLHEVWLPLPSVNETDAWAASFQILFVKVLVVEQSAGRGAVKV